MGQQNHRKCISYNNKKQCKLLTQIGDMPVSFRDFYLQCFKHRRFSVIYCIDDGCQHMLRDII